MIALTPPQRISSDLSAPAPGLRQTTPRAAAAERMLNSIAMIDVSPLGIVESTTEKASILLERYFPGLNSDQLPEALLRWIQTRSTGWMGPITPWHIERGSRQLVIRLAGTEGGYLQLLLEETPARTLSAEQLEALGLTPREAEVLLWIAQGKTSPEISMILQCATATVTKHTERIFAKLGVETRTAAAAIALEVSASSASACFA